MMRTAAQKVGRRAGATRRIPERWKRLPRAPLRIFRLHPEPGRRELVEVRLARTRRAMSGAWAFYEGRHLGPGDDQCMGRCQSYISAIDRRASTLANGVVARIYLNVRDVRQHPSEVPSHECAHAAMAYARLRRANLSRMPGEEVMCHALGRLVEQLNVVLFASKTFLS